MNTACRLDKTRRIMREKGLGCLVVTSPANCLYLSGFTGDNGILVITPETQTIFTDFRFIEQAAQEAPEYTVHRCSAVKLLPELGEWLNEQVDGSIGFEPEHFSVRDYQNLTAAVAAERLAPAGGLVEKLRAVKDQDELELIARAAAIGDRAWQGLLPSIKPGVSERDLAAELEYLLRREGADGTSFTTIVASGHRGALPHGTASAKLLNRGELVIFDFGARLNGYCADMTRTISLGPPDAKGAEIYRVAREAQEAALAAIGPGLDVREIDAVARELIARHGYGDNFGHGLGHAVGLEIHEEPRLSPTGEGRLAPGMVVTVEPGIYLPGYGGVRIEDLVVVTEDGHRNLTGSRKDLLIL